MTLRELYRDWLTNINEQPLKFPDWVEKQGYTVTVEAPEPEPTLHEAVEYVLDEEPFLGKGHFEMLKKALDADNSARVRFNAAFAHLRASQSRWAASGAAEDVRGMSDAIDALAEEVRE